MRVPNQLLGLMLGSVISQGVFADDWATYGNGLDNQRFSSLSEVNRANVDKLQLAWKFDSGIKGSFQTSPIKVGDHLYISTPFNHVVALDAGTGEQEIGRASCRERVYAPV